MKLSSFVFTVTSVNSPLPVMIIWLLLACFSLCLCNKCVPCYDMSILHLFFYDDENSFILKHLI